MCLCVNKNEKILYTNFGMQLFAQKSSTTDKSKDVTRMKCNENFNFMQSGQITTIKNVNEKKYIKDCF